MNETRPRDPSSSAGAIAAQPHEEQLDDWLGDISDDDWSESATDTAERRRAGPADRRTPVPEEGLPRDPTADFPSDPVAAAQARQAIVKRRRRVAGVAVVVLLALAIVIPVLLLRGGGESPVAPVAEGPSTTPTRTTTSPSSAPTTPATTPSTTPSSTTPSADSAAAFTLPEGTKLQRGEGDPAVASDLEAITDPEVVTELQQALSSAGYDPGPADGTFGPRTEAAVVAFQQANGLSADGIVGPDTASALNAAVAGG